MKTRKKRVHFSDQFLMIDMWFRWLEWGTRIQKRYYFRIFYGMFSSFRYCPKRPSS